MFERFTERARQVVVLAQDEARALRHDYIGTEHLLLGLVREEDGLAARVLGSLDVTIEEAQAQVARIVGQGDRAPAGQIPFTRRAKKVLELSLSEAMALGHSHIGTEHILLGLVGVEDAVGCRVLEAFDISPDTLRDELIRALSAGGAGRTRPRRRAWTTYHDPGGGHAERRPGWEYRVVIEETVQEDQLNSLGAEGWQLVAVVGGGPYQFVFKRRSQP